MNKYLQPLIMNLQKNANSSNSFKMAKYMRNQFEFYGIKSPEVKKITSQFYKIYGKPNADNWKEIVTDLWKLPERENQFIAQNLCLKMKSNWKQEDIEFFKWLTINKSWWDTVDFIATNLVGNYFKIYPLKKETIIKAYINDENMWLNRVAILFQLKYKRETDRDLLKANCLKKINHTDFFIRKAIGWSLREYAKTDADWVYNFIDKNNFSNLTKRETNKHRKMGNNKTI